MWHNSFIFKLNGNGGRLENLLNLLQDLLKERKQSAVLIEQVFTSKNINARVLQGSILSVLLFLIYIYDLTWVLTANAKLSANDASLFSVIHDNQTSANDLSKDL